MGDKRRGRLGIAILADGFQNLGQPRRGLPLGALHRLVTLMASFACAARGIIDQLLAALTASSDVTAAIYSSSNMSSPPSPIRT